MQKIVIVNGDSGNHVDVDVDVADDVWQGRRASNFTLRQNVTRAQRTNY